MGKRNRKGKLAVGDVEGSMPRSVRRDTLELVGILLERCSYPFGNRNKEWEDFLEVHAIVEKLRAKQQGYVLSHADREANMEAFTVWVKENGVDTAAVSIEKFDEGGFGLKAKRDIKMSELFLSIPRKTMMTTATAESSVLGSVVKEDRILQAMPNVVLALHLLCEKCDPKSFWAPYIKILPDHYTTPLYFSVDELQLLRGSPACSTILNQFRNIARQYAYFFKLFQGFTDAKLKLPIKNFCYDDYRWAVATVMTRQNQIPSVSGDQTDMALIPYWDMCNHCNGRIGMITTDFNRGKDRSECYSVRDFSKGNQVFIFYGPRCNSELLNHSGFVYLDNSCDRMTLQLGVSRDDPLYSMKAELLARLSMMSSKFVPTDRSRLFSLHHGPVPVDSELLSYLRIFSMDQERLAERLTGENAQELMIKLRDFESFIDLKTELKAWNFLETRMALLLKLYTTAAFMKYITVEDGTEKLLPSQNLSECARLCVMLRLCEKRLLQSTMNFAREQKTIVTDVFRQREEDAKLGTPVQESGPVDVGKAGEPALNGIGDAGVESGGGSKDVGKGDEVKCTTGEAQVDNVLASLEKECEREVHPNKTAENESAKSTTGDIQTGNSVASLAKGCDVHPSKITESNSAKCTVSEAHVDSSVASLEKQSEREVNSSETVASVHKEDVTKCTKDVAAPAESERGADVQKDVLTSEEKSQEDGTVMEVTGTKTGPDSQAKHVVNEKKSYSCAENKAIADREC